MNNEYSLRVIAEPKRSPCEQCEKHCTFGERGDCEKINEYNEKIIRKAYDYDKAVEIMAKVLAVANTGCKLCVEGKEVNAKEFAAAALKALLGRK